MESNKRSSDNCLTSEPKKACNSDHVNMLRAGSDKVESKSNTSNCFTSETNSDKVQSETSTINCPTSETSTINCPTPETSKINCPTSETNTINCPTSETSTINCPTSDTSTINCPTSETSTMNCPTSETSSNKRSAIEWPTPTPKKACVPDHENLLSAEKDPNEFIMTCLQNASKDIMKYVTKEAEKIKEFKSRDFKQKYFVLSNVSNIIFTRCFDIMLDKIVCGEKQITMLYYNKYPEANELDEEVTRMLIGTSSNSCSGKMESKSPTLESRSDKMESKIGTSDCPTLESSSDKMESESSTIICPTLESSSDKMESESSTIICPTLESSSDKMESKIGTSDCPTLDSSSDKMESKICTSDCPTLDSSSDKMEPKSTNSDCPTLESSLDKIESKSSTSGCPTLESSSDKIESESSTSICSTLETSSDKLQSKIGTSDCPTLESSLDKMESESCASICATLELNSEKEENGMDKEINSKKCVNEINSEKNEKEGDDDNGRNIETEREKLVNQKSKENGNKHDPVFRVKLISMPDLPSKELILNFLNQFNTKGIKKHKTMKNLLVIDLKTENDYNKILNACGTKIGPHKFLIRKNETNDSDMKENNENVKSQTIENKTGDVIPEVQKVINEIANSGQCDKINSEEGTIAQKEVEHAIKQEPEDECLSEISDEIIKQEPEDVCVNEIRDEIIKQEPNDTTVKVEKDDGGTDERIVKREVEASVNTTQTINTDNVQFVVRLIAYPFLPERETIANFIKKYNPIAIKKNKKVDNVLLITFNNETDCENFVSMDGYCIANNDCCTEIRVTLIANQDLCSDFSEESSVSSKDHTVELVSFNDSEVIKEELASTSQARSDPTAATKKRRRQLSGAAKRRIDWWIARGKSLDEAKILCKKPLHEFPEYIDEMQAFLPPDSTSTSIQNIFGMIATTESVVDHHVSTVEAKGSEEPGGISEDSANTSGSRSDPTAATKKRTQLSGAAKRRISWWMARGKSLDEAKALCKKPLHEYQEYIDEKGASLTLKAAASTNEKVSELAFKQVAKPIIGHDSKPSFWPEVKPDIEQLNMLSTGHAEPSIGRVLQPTMGSVKPALGQTTKPIIGQVTQPTGQAIEPATGELSKLNTGQVESDSIHVKKKRIEFEGAIDVGILDASGPIPQDRIEVLKACILRHIDAMPEGKGPKFLRCCRRAGGIVISCTEEGSRRWLESAVTKMQPWDGAMLRVVNASELKTRYATAFVRDARIRQEQVLRLLHKQNVGLYIPSWRIVNRYPQGTGYVYTFSFDEAVVPLLLEWGLKLFLGFDQISLRLKGPGCS